MEKINQKGFTLIELILYIGIASFMLLVVFLFVSQILEVRTKGQVIAEVEQQGYWAVQVITQAIRNSKAPINLPAVASSGPSLSLTMADGTKNPTAFSLSSGAILMSESGGSTIPLTNSNITISNLNFQNLTANGTKGNIKFSFDVNYNSQAGSGYEFKYLKTFYATASVRY